MSKWVYTKEYSHNAIQEFISTIPNSSNGLACEKVGEQLHQCFQNNKYILILKHYLCST